MQYHNEITVELRQFRACAGHFLQANIISTAEEKEKEKCDINLDSCKLNNSMETMRKSIEGEEKSLSNSDQHRNISTHNQTWINAEV